MRAWVGGDVRTLKTSTSRKFRMVVGSKPWCARLQQLAPRGLPSFATPTGSAIYTPATSAQPTVFATQLDLKASIDGHDWFIPLWVTDIWRKSGVRRSWKMVERVLVAA